jgi:hypothetical protein
VESQANKITIRAFLAAIALGIAPVALCNITWVLVRGYGSLWDDALPFQAGLAAFPFLLLTLIGTRRALPWLVGITLTALFWGLYLYRILSFDGGGGADIGLGILMLFSPIPISIGSVGAVFLPNIITK